LKSNIIFLEIFSVCWKNTLRSTAQSCSWDEKYGHVFNAEGTFFSLSRFQESQRCQREVFGLLSESPTSLRFNISESAHFYVFGTKNVEKHARVEFPHIVKSCRKSRFEPKRSALKNGMILPKKNAFFTTRPA